MLPLLTRPLAAALLLATLSPAHAQSAQINESDLAALRYFLSIEDTASSAAERARLMQEFPDADIDGMIDEMTTRAVVIDTTEMWRLIEANEFEAARTLIERTQSSRPDWTPPEEMMTVLDEKQAQSVFETAMAAEDLLGALSAVNTYPDLLTCGRINNAWRLAELQTAQNLQDQAVLTNTGILTACRTPDHVVATLQKTARIASSEAMKSLFDLARTRNPEMTARLAALEEELAPIIGVPETETQTAAASDAAQTPPQPRATPPAAAPAPQPAAAPQVTRAAPAPVPAAPSAGGALSAAARAADRNDWATCLELTSGARSAEELSQRGWCAMNFGRPREAVAAFTTAARNTSNATLRRDSNYGAILSYMSAGMTSQAAALFRQADLTTEQRRNAARSVLSALASESFENRQYADTIAYIDRLSQSVGTLDRGMAMLRGYALLSHNRQGAAREQFRAVHASQPGPDSLRAITQTMR